MVNIKQAVKAKELIIELLDKTHADPLMLRTAWHDAGSFDKDDTNEATCGGARAGIIHKPQLGYGCNAGVDCAVTLLDPIKDACPEVSWADLLQIAGAAAVEHCGGPEIQLRIGRIDATGAEQCSADGRLPAAGSPFPDGCPNAQDHLRKIFYRMGIDDKEIVALSGSHTIGRVNKDRSGATDKEVTAYTSDPSMGRVGGQSWTAQWLKFDNQYFKDVKNPADAELIVLETDAVLFSDEKFREYAEIYAADQDAFFRDYAAAHIKLSELGAKWEEGTPVELSAAAAVEAAATEVQDAATAGVTEVEKAVNAVAAEVEKAAADAPSEVKDAMTAAVSEVEKAVAAAPAEIEKAVDAAAAAINETAATTKDKKGCVIC